MEDDEQYRDNPAKIIPVPNATIIATAAIPQRLDQLEDAVNGLAGVLQAHKDAIDALASLVEAIYAKQVEIDTRLLYKPFTGPPTDIYTDPEA